MTTSETLNGLLDALAHEPDNAGLVAAATDYLMERGLTPRGAVRKVAMAVNLARAVRAVESSPRLRTRIRRAVGCEGNPPVEVIAGSARPTRHGEEAYHTFRGGNTRVNAPGSAIKRGFKLDYHPSTLRVTVGAVWVMRNLS
jgi:hypothetical protein